ncbi:MAG: exosortase A [Rubrivivax sp.]|nr:exosortase A [Rubrivivax sp.]
MSAVPADLRITSPWRTALPVFLLLVAAIGLLYRDTAMVMAGIWWRSETFAHCMLVLPISLWLVWRRREPLAALTPQAQPWVLLPLLAVATVWLLSDLVVVNAGAQFAFVAMLVLTVPAVLGLAVAREILFPLLFLFFAVPFGEFAVPTMMELTADFTVYALQVTGVPVFREGQNFVIPTGSWSVIDECSGVRYLMASFMVGTLFAYLNYRSYLRRTVFMAVALVLPILANWFRAYIIVMLAHLSGNRIATGVDHILYGWVFFGLIIFIMFIVGARWSQPDDLHSGAGTASGRSGSSGAQPGAARRMLAVALCGAFIAWLPHLAVAGLQRAEGTAAPARIDLPARLAGGWSSEGAQLTAWAPEFGNPSAEASRVYAAAAGTVGVHLYYYRGQGEGRKVVSSQNALVGMRDAQWIVPVGSGVRDVAVAGQTIALRTTEILGRVQGVTARPAPLVVWRVYWIDGRFIAGDAAAKVAGVLARLRGRGDEGAALLLYADGPTVAASNAALEAFVQANLGSLNALLQRTRDAR